MPAELRDAIERGAGIRNLRVESGMVRPGSSLWRVIAEMAGRPRRLVVKVTRHLRPEDEAVRSRAARVRVEFETLGRLRGELAPWPELRVPEPILCLPEHQAVVLEEVGGETLHSLVLGRARGMAGPAGWARVARAFRAAGRWLGVVQSVGPRPRGRFDLESLRDYDEVRLGWLLELGCLSPRLADRVREESARLRDLVPQGTGRESVFAHGDFCPGNILVDGQAIVVLDFTMAECGSIHQDLAYCFEYLERFLDRILDRPLIRRRRIRELQNALLEGYRERMPFCEPLFRLNQIRHHLNYLVNMHAPVGGLRGWVARFDRWRARRGLEMRLDRSAFSAAGGEG